MKGHDGVPRHVYVSDDAWYNLMRCAADLGTEYENLCRLNGYRDDGFVFVGNAFHVRSTLRRKDSVDYLARADVFLDSYDKAASRGCGTGDTAYTLVGEAHIHAHEVPPNLRISYRNHPNQVDCDESSIVCRSKRWGRNDWVEILLGVRLLDCRSAPAFSEGEDFVRLPKRVLYYARMRMRGVKKALRVEASARYLVRTGNSISEEHEMPLLLRPRKWLRPQDMPRYLRGS